jgi:metal-responsive CopG/Arc/MetJ family transcriptional regulator
MPKKLDDEVQRLHMVVPTTLIENVDAWRRREEDLPNLSEAIRRLIEMGLEGARKARQQR